MEDPGNQIYAAWLYTVAGVKRDVICSNNRENIGDNLECALALCWMIDEYPKENKRLLGDPNSM